MTSRRPERALDTHVHIWTYDSPWMKWIEDRPASWDVIRRDVPWDELRAELDSAGVGELILMQACPTPEETVMLLEVAAREPSAVGVVGWASLRSPQATERDLLSFEASGANKLVGIRAMHGWDPEGEILAQEPTLDACRLLAERKLPLDIFLRDPSELALAASVADRVPEGRYIINHLGRPPIGGKDGFTAWADAIEELSKRPNIFVKYSGWATFVGRARADDVRPYIDHVLETFGADRTLFASNWPVALVADDYATTYAATLAAVGHLTDDELDQIMYRTAASVYLSRT